jgi:hypothetical protein
LKDPGIEAEPALEHAEKAHAANKQYRPPNPAARQIRKEADHVTEAKEDEQRGDQISGQAECQEEPAAQMRPDRPDPVVKRVVGGSGDDFRNVFGVVGGEGAQQQKTARPGTAQSQ